MDIQAEISKLKREKNGIILAHNYQSPEIQDIADILGDSLDLAKRAADTTADIIIFCGVDFMADTAKIVSPDKIVISPQKMATCPMANMISVEALQKLKADNPKAKVVTYVNSTAEVKALTDVCCTSANAVNVVQNIDAEEIIFVPDKNLGKYCQRFTTKKLIFHDGYCHVHNSMDPLEIVKAKEAMTDAPVLVHPECPPAIIDLADEVLSTSGMLEYVKNSKKKRFLIGTEVGIIYRMQKENRDKQIFSAGTPKVCPDMKKTSLEDVYEALLNEQNQIEIDSTVATNARKALTEMMKY